MPVQVLKGNINVFETNPQDWYSDERLKAAFVDTVTGLTSPDYDPQGNLDLYAPHAYPFWWVSRFNRLSHALVCPYQQSLLVDNCAVSDSVCLKCWQLITVVAPVLTQISWFLFCPTVLSVLFHQFLLSLSGATCPTV